MQFELEADLIERLPCRLNMHVQHVYEPCRHFWHRVTQACRSPFQGTLSSDGLVTILGADIIFDAPSEALSGEA